MGEKIVKQEGNLEERVVVNEDTREALTNKEKDFLKEIGTELYSNIVFQNSDLSDGYLIQHRIGVSYRPTHRYSPKEKLGEMASISCYDKEKISIYPYDMFDTIKLIKLEKDFLGKLDSLDIGRGGVRFSYKGKVVTIGFENGLRRIANTYAEIYTKYGREYTPKKLSRKI